MAEGASADIPAEATVERRLAIRLAMAMFVLVVDTSLMNVSIDQDERSGYERFERDGRLDAADGGVEIPNHR